MINILRLMVIFCALLNSLAAISPAHAQIQALSISTLNSPMPVPTSDGQLLVYELHFFNSGSVPLRIDRIEIRGDDKHLLKAYAGSRLIKNSFMYEAKKLAQANVLELKRNMGAFVYVWLPLLKTQAAPGRLSHKIWVVSTNSDQSLATTDVIAYDLSVNPENPPVLGPPLTGNYWVAAAAISPDSYHRRSILPIDGQFYLAQRYAIDWEQMCPDGKAVHGDMHDNLNWSAFGQPVLAVADGVITKKRDSIKNNNIPPSLPSPPPGLIDTPGNYVILKVSQNGKNYYVLYAHLQPGSIRVKAGDKVKQGQVIGNLGNTGNSSAPHLHMHVTTGNDPLKSDGVPFVFEKMILQGKAKTIDDDYGLWLPPSGPDKTIEAVIPSTNQVIHFSDTAQTKCPD